MFEKRNRFHIPITNHISVFLLKKLSQRTFSIVSCLAEAPVVEESRVRRGARDDETRTEKRVAILVPGVQVAALGHELTVVVSRRQTLGR